jgi:hypothetical protein
VKKTKSQASPKQFNWSHVPGYCAITAIGIVAVIFLLLILGALFGANDRTNPSNYRVVSNGSIFKVEKRVWPFWNTDVWSDDNTSLEQAQRWIDASIKTAVREKNPPDGPWIEVTPELRWRFEQSKPPEQTFTNYGVLRMSTNEDGWIYWNTDNP